MKERPIRLSAPKVRALLNGTKTQDRWAVKLYPGEGMALHFVGGIYQPKQGHHVLALRE